MISDKELCKYFEYGNHVKVVSGAMEGATGMVVSVEGHVVHILSDATKEEVCQSWFDYLEFCLVFFYMWIIVYLLSIIFCFQLRVFADNVVESTEVS